MIVSKSGIFLHISSLYNSLNQQRQWPAAAAAKKNGDLTREVQRTEMDIQVNTRTRDVLTFRTSLGCIFLILYSYVIHRSMICASLA